MKKKVKKFGRGGDILTGIGAAIIGKHLYDKYMGDKEEAKPEAVKSRYEGMSEREKIAAQRGERGTDTTPVIPKDKYLETHGGKTPTETGTRVNPLYSGDEEKPAPAPKKVIPKKEKPASQTFPTDNDALNKRRLEGLKPKSSGDSQSTTTPPSKGITGYAPVTRFSPTKKDEDKPKLTRNPVTNKKVLEGMKKGGAVKSSASKRADGIAQRGKTRGRIL